MSGPSLRSCRAPFAGRDVAARMAEVVYEMWYHFKDAISSSVHSDCDNCRDRKVANFGHTCTGGAHVHMHTL